MKWLIKLGTRKYSDTQYSFFTLSFTRWTGEDTLKVQNLQSELAESNRKIDELEVKLRSCDSQKGAFDKSTKKIGNLSSETDFYKKFMNNYEANEYCISF